MAAAPVFPDSTKHELNVDEAAVGSRLDRWLAQAFPQLSRALIQRYIGEGRVLAHGVAAKPSTKLRARSIVTVWLPPPAPEFPLPQAIALKVLFEDHAIIVLDKPPDLVVHSAPGVATGGSIVNALLNFTDRLSREGGATRPGIVHRLDRETSGVLLIARTDAAHRKLAAQFKAREVKKEYVACVHGVPGTQRGVVDSPLGRSLVQRRKMALRFDAAGKQARTEWWTERTLPRFSWLKLHPLTGRTHQIRVHLHSIGHPIACDALYGREKKLTRSELLGRALAQGETAILARHALHARSLRFRHPESGEAIQFEAPLPHDMQAVYEVFLSATEECD